MEKTRKAKCPQCNKIFEVPYIGYNCQKYCSKYCRYRRDYRVKYQYFLQRNRDNYSGYKPGKIQCLICQSRFYDNLALHLSNFHGMKAEQYCEKFGTDRDSMASEKTRDILRKNTLKNGTYKNLILGSNKYNNKKYAKTKSKKV